MGLRTIDELKDQIKQHEERIFEISQQVRAIAWETKQRTEAIKNLKREIKLAKREARQERWRGRLDTQQDIKELTKVRFWPAEKATKPPIPPKENKNKVSAKSSSK